MKHCPWRVPPLFLPPKHTCLDVIAICHFHRPFNNLPAIFFHLLAVLFLYSSPLMSLPEYGALWFCKGTRARSRGKTRALGSSACHSHNNCATDTYCVNAYTPLNLVQIYSTTPASSMHNIRILAAEGCGLHTSFVLEIGILGVMGDLPDIYFS